MYEPNVSEGLSEEVNVKAMSKEALAKYIEECQRELDERTEKERVDLLADIKDKILEYKELLPTVDDFDLARKIGLNVSWNDRTEKVQVKEKKKQKQSPHFYYKDSDGVEHITGSTSPRALSKSPWKELIEDGTINNYTVKYEKNINGEMKYWTKSNEDERPDDALPVNRNGVNLEKIKKSIRSIA
ncbi:hypothetical protein [Vibrio parahaemolyticus]|uniref:hypothetical protein n=1 Tax=Vibrio parahaemolyticus TaxID=670 RepID=UPI0004085A31|nr:hypothetical protein [Vibrio parahaemolyticus]MBE3894648.1 hypothetical protein [Vibrio parahaemolyticus]